MPNVCLCVCLCRHERERERERSQEALNESLAAAVKKDFTNLRKVSCHDVVVRVDILAMATNKSAYSHR